MKNLLLFLLTGMVCGCAADKLKPLTMALDSVYGYGKVDAHFCTLPPSPAKQYLKYLFVLDHSASNQAGFPNSLTPSDVTNTDPQGARRYGPMINFIQGMVPDPNNVTSFSIIDFNDTAYQPGTLSGFDPNSSDFVNVATQDWIGGGTAQQPAPEDKGFTNYQAALQMALQMIKQDAQVLAAGQDQSIKVSYQIIFVSDGVPTVAAPIGSLSPIYTQTFGNDIQPVIANLMNLKNDPSLGPYISNINLNTAYYFMNTEVVAAETLLQQMANAGNGLYLQFGSGQNILYQQFAPPSRNVINQLADVFVENVNGVWWDDGRFMLDSDGDGLPDLIEMQYGSNPNLKDSDGNGVSDLVEFRTKGKPCNDPHCLPANRDPYAICSGFNPVQNGAATSFAATSNDGLNDCEKFLLGALRSTFNSNGDMIPDFLALKNSIPFIPGSASAAFADPFGDGISNYMKLKEGLPVQVSQKELNNFTMRAVTLNAEANPSPDISCYHLQVDHVALSGTENRIRVMVVQNGATISNKPFMQTAERSMDGSLSVSFTPGDFN